MLAITTKSRVWLRPLEAADITSEYVSWFGDTIVTEFLDSSGFTIDDAIAYMHKGRDDGTYYMYAVIDQETGLHIGNVKVGPIQSGHGVSDLVTVIGRRDFWGKGFATEAIKAGNDIAFQKYGIRKLSGGITDGNEGSVKAYTKAGWVIEGRLKGHHLINGIARDRIIVSCFNPKYFPDMASE